jgi:hypothetical protein
VKGRARRELIVGAMSLPFATAREPFWLLALVEGVWREYVCLKTNWWTEVLLEVYHY